MALDADYARSLELAAAMNLLAYATTADARERTASGEELIKFRESCSTAVDTCLGNVDLLAKIARSREVLLAEGEIIAGLKQLAGAIGDSRQLGERCGAFLSLLGFPGQPGEQTG